MSETQVNLKSADKAQKTIKAKGYRNMKINFLYKLQNLPILFMFLATLSYGENLEKDAPKEFVYLINRGDLKKPAKMVERSAISSLPQGEMMLQMGDPIIDSVELAKPNKVENRKPVKFEKSKTSILTFKQRNIQGRLKQPRVAFNAQEIPINLKDKKTASPPSRPVFSLPLKDL